MELHAQAFGRSQARERFFVGQAHDHFALFGITHGGGKWQVADSSRCIECEEADAASVFEVVGYVGVFAPCNFYNEAVERVVVATPDGDGKPAFAALDAASYAHCFGFASHLRFLIFVFKTQEGTLAREGEWCHNFCEQ